MKLLKLNILKGANYWSYTKKKLIVIKIDFEGIEKSLNIHFFLAKLKILLPSLYNYNWLKKKHFFDVMESNFSLSQVIGHIACAIQNLVGMQALFEKVLNLREKDQHKIIFSYEFEAAGVYAAHTAIKIVDCLTRGGEYLNLEKDIKHLADIFKKEQLGPSTLSLIKEAEKRDIPWTIHTGQPFVVFGNGSKQKKMWMTVSSNTSSIGVETASDKDLTKKILSAHFIPTPKGFIISSEKEFKSIQSLLSFPLTVKPFNGNHGDGVICNIKNQQDALKSFEIAKQFSDKIIVEEYISGFDYRFLIVNFKLIAAALRTPAQIIGDGYKTVDELIAELNQDPQRGIDHEKALTRVSLDESTYEILKKQNLTLNSILKKNEVLILKYTANISSGGTATDVTEYVHPYNKKLVERIARIVDLDICGIDAIAEDIRQPMTNKNSAILEVNAAPGLRMHLAPTKGYAKNVAVPIMDWLFPSKLNTRIPIVAVTGTNGKTTVVRLIAFLAKQNNFKVGFTTTDGIYLENELIFEGDCSGAESAQAVLFNPNVDFAVLECARGGILKSGLGFDTCDISIITNITEDHLGIDDIHSIEELTQIKSVIAHSTRKDGYAILNADDNLVYALKDQLKCKIALFALQKNERIISHCDSNGMAAYIKDHWIVICKNSKEIKVAPIKDIPLSFNGAVDCMVQNILAALLAAVLSNFELSNIIKGLKGFKPSEVNTPGRMNLYEFNNFKIMLDYAHNPGSFIEIKKYLASLNCSKKIGIISATGDRAAKDIQTLGSLSAQMFDEIIIMHNKDKRGSTNEHLTNLLLEGIHRQDSHSKVKIISNEFAALHYALENIRPNTFIFYTVEDVFESLRNLKMEVKNRKMDS